MATIVYTNHHRRDTELVGSLWKAQLQQLAKDTGIDWRDFSPTDRVFEYRGELWPLSEFISMDNVWATMRGDLEEWDGFVSLTAFSGVVVKLIGDGEQVIVGRYLSTSG